jgi:P27 family predicted phage terminase small subunit
VAGRPRKSIAEKRLEGNRSKTPLDDPPEFPKGEMKCPRWLSREAKKFWKKIVPILQEASGLLEICDQTALEGFCETYAQWKEASIILQEEGMTFSTDKGYIQQRPEVAIVQKSSKSLMDYMNAFGLTPSSRSRLGIKPPPKGDGFDDF